MSAELRVTTGQRFAELPLAPARGPTIYVPEPGSYNVFVQPLLDGVEPSVTSPAWGLEAELELGLGSTTVLERYRCRAVGQVFALQAAQMRVGARRIVSAGTMGAVIAAQPSEVYARWSESRSFRVLSQSASADQFIPAFAYAARWNGDPGLQLRFLNGAGQNVFIEQNVPAQIEIPEVALAYRVVNQTGSTATPFVTWLCGVPQ